MSETKKATTAQTIAALNTICNGWTESRPGALLCNPNKGGGIIDAEMGSGEWFVIFNDGRPGLEGYDSREDAIEAFVIASRTVLTVANTIKNQLGSSLVMLGAHNLTGTSDALMFAIRGSKKVTHINIKLEADDTYTMTFMRLRRARLAIHERCETVRQESGVYVNSLINFIESVTGLAVKL